MTTRTGKGAKPTGIARFIPMLSWAPSYNRSWLRPDVIAGVSVAALVVPKSLGYASIAGVPIEHGLYAAAAGALLYAVFGTSRQIATGPSSALAAVAAGAVIGAGISKGSEDAVAMVAAITIGSGILFLLMAIFKMGWISQFLSKAVITGFLFGAAIDVVIGELAKITGTEIEGANSWQELRSWIEGLSKTDMTTLLVGVGSLILIFTLRFTVPRVPEALVLVVLGIGASILFDLGEAGVALIGDVPRGLPSLELPDIEFVIDNFSVILAASVGLLLIGFSQTTGDARDFAAKHRYQIDINQESVAQGMCNVGSGLFQGIPVSTSLSASSLSDQSGAKTQMASLTTGFVVVLTMLFLAPVFADLPKAVLAAIIIEAVVMGMVNVPEMKRMWRVSRPDFWIAVAAILGVLSAGVLTGVLIGVVLSLGRLIYLSTTPRMPELGRVGGTQAFLDVEEHENLRTYPGVMILRFDAALFFATAASFEDGIRNHAQEADPEIKTLVLDFEGVDFIDSQGSGQLKDILDLGSTHDIEIRVARIKSPVKHLLERDGVIDVLGADRIYGNVYEAVADLIPRDADSA